MKKIHLIHFLCFLFLFACSSGSGGGENFFSSPIDPSTNGTPSTNPTGPSSNPSTPTPSTDPTTPPEETDPCFLSAQSPLEALLNCGCAIVYSPPFPHNPAIGVYLTVEQHTSFIQQLFNENFKILILYSLDNTFEFVPQIAKNIGFRYVIGAAYWYDSAQLERERAAALRQKDFIDNTLIIGNEGIWDRRYTAEELATEVAYFEAQGFQVMTSEGYDSYVENPSLLLLGSASFPTLHPWWAGFREPSEGVNWAAIKYQELQELAPGATIFLKEVWWPTSSSNSDDIAANEENQLEFYTLLAQTQVKFAVGEACDQSWKIENGILYGWGIHTSEGLPKLIIQYLNEIWTLYQQ